MCRIAALMFSAMGDDDPAETRYELPDPMPVRLSAGKFIAELIKHFIGFSDAPNARYRHNVIDRESGHVVYSVVTDNAMEYRFEQRALRHDIQSLTCKGFMRKYVSIEPKLLRDTSRRRIRRLDVTQ